ncbi:hypothetical protein [Arthrobacter sp.]
MAKAQQELTDGTRKWTPADAVEATNLRARGWKPADGKPAAKADTPKSNK